MWKSWILLIKSTACIFNGILFPITSAPRLTVTPSDYLYVLPNDTRATITCNTTHPQVGTAWIINGFRTLLPTVYLVTNYLELLVTPSTINSLNGTVYECVAYDPDVIEGPPAVISRAKTVFLKATGEWLGYFEVGVCCQFLFIASILFTVWDAFLCLIKNISYST